MQNKGNFDGPSFVNPSHTSYGLNNSSGYQTPQMNFSGKSTANQYGPNKNNQIGGAKKKGPKGK